VRTVISFHSGNKAFRCLIQPLKEAYRLGSRENKQKIVAEVLGKWSSLDPPGKFLHMQRHPHTGAPEWHEVSLGKARARISKSLAEYDPRRSHAEKTSSEASTSSSYKSRSVTSTDLDRPAKVTSVESKPHENRNTAKDECFIITSESTKEDSVMLDKLKSKALSHTSLNSPSTLTLSNPMWNINDELNAYMLDEKPLHEIFIPSSISSHQRTSVLSSLATPIVFLLVPGERSHKAR